MPITTNPFILSFLKIILPTVKKKNFNNCTCFSGITRQVRYNALVTTVLKEWIFNGIIGFIFSPYQNENIFQNGKMMSCSFSRTEAIFFIFRWIRLIRLLEFLDRTDSLASNDAGHNPVIYMENQSANPALTRAGLVWL
jgi:hypothetical protein